MRPVPLLFCIGFFYAILTGNVAAVVSPSEALFIATCQDLRGGGRDALEQLPTDKFPDAFFHLRPRSEASIECVPVYLSFFASIAPGPRPWRMGRALIWNLVEEARDQYSLQDSYRQLSIVQLSGHSTRHSDSPFRFVLQAALRTLEQRDDGEFTDDDRSAAAGLLGGTAYFRRSLMIVDPRANFSDVIASAHLREQWAMRVAGPLDIETHAIETLVALGVAELFDANTVDVLVAALFARIRNSALWTRTDNPIPMQGYAARRFAALLLVNHISAQSRRSAHRVFVLLSARKKLMRPDYALATQAQWSMPMAVSYDSELYLGRCGSRPGPSAQNATSVSHHQDGARCSYDGTEGYANLDVALIETRFTTDAQDGVTSAAAYAIEVGSRMRGGYRKGRPLRSGENQTASVKYSLTGSARIPQCKDVRTCNPVVWLSVADISHEPDAGAQRTTVVQIQSPSVSTTLTAVPIAVDRSDGPIDINIRASRAAGHVGACCELDWGRHALTVTANGPVVRSLWDFDVGATIQDAYMLAFFQPPRPADRAQHLIAQELVQIAQNEREFANRFRGIYLRLLATHVLLETPGLELSAVETTGLRDARGILTLEARAAYFEAARQAFRSTETVLRDIDLPAFIDGINQAIEQLLQTQDDQPIGRLDMLAALTPRVAPLDEPDRSELSGLSMAVRTAASQSQRNDTIIALMRLRGKLRSVINDWVVDMRDLATELTQIDPTIQDKSRN